MSALTTLFGLARTAGAQAEPSSTAVVRATEGNVSAELATAVDSAVGRELTDQAGVANAIVSPVALDEIRLNIGCQGESRECLASVAETLQARSLVIRTLSVDAAGTVALRLLRFDAAVAGEPAVVRATSEPGAQAAIVNEVPRLVRELFGLPPKPAAEATSPSPPVVARAEAPPSEAVSDRREPGGGATVSPLTWVALGVGGAVLAGGIVLGLSAQSSYDDAQRTPVETRADADRLSADYDALETKATIANVLIPAGAAVLGLGATLLVLDLTSDGDEERSATLRVLPSSEGGMLLLRGPLGGP